MCRQPWWFLIRNLKSLLVIKSGNGLDIFVIPLLNHYLKIDNEKLKYNERSWTFITVLELSQTSGKAFWISKLISNHCITVLLLTWTRISLYFHIFFCLGFYGRPWTSDQRKRLFKWMKTMGMNTYLYAPKDDAKHRMYWRDLYSVEEAGEGIDSIGSGN